MLVKVTIPIKIESVANLRENWRERAKRSKKHRTAAYCYLAMYSQPINTVGPMTITLTRIATRQLDDDNLASGFKAVRDGVADWLKRPDNDPLISWRYSQEKGEPKKYAASITIEWSTI